MSPPPDTEDPQDLDYVLRALRALATKIISWQAQMQVMLIIAAIFVVLAITALFLTTFNNLRHTSAASRSDCLSLSQTLSAAVNNLRGDIANLQGDLTELSATLDDERAGAKANLAVATDPTQSSRTRGARLKQATSETTTAGRILSALQLKRASIALKRASIRVDELRIDPSAAPLLADVGDQETVLLYGRRCKRVFPDPSPLRVFSG